MVNVIIDKLADYSIEKMMEWVNENKSQKILLKCFKEYYESNKEMCYVDKKVILSIDGDKIKPNLEPEKIIKNIQSVLDRSIKTDDPYKRKSIETQTSHIDFSYAP